MRSFRRIALTAVIGCLAILGPASSVQAAAFYDFKCSSWLTWRGSILVTLPPTMADDRSDGTLKACLTVEQKSETNSSYNFYEIRLEVEWDISNNGGTTNNHAFGHLAITPNAVDEKATPSIQSDHTCFDPLDLSYSYYGFGVGIHPQICWDTWIYRTYESKGIVHWDTKNVLKTHYWDLVYFVKTNASARPDFSAGVHYPWYTITYDYGCFCWRNSEVQRLVSLTIVT
jgi:hypothetical protein